MSQGVALLHAGLEGSISAWINGVSPQEGFTGPILTRRVELSKGIELVHQEKPNSGGKGTPSGEYTATIIDRREHEPPRVYSFSNGSQLGALACECLDPGVATGISARSKETWHGLNTTCGSAIATLMSFMLEQAEVPDALIAAS